MAANSSAVAVFQTHVKAEEAVRQFQNNGFEMTKLSIVGKDCHTNEHVVGYYNAGDHMMYWGKAGAHWGSFSSQLFGSSFFAIPGVGRKFVADSPVAWIIGMIEGAAVVGGVSALGAALAGIGIPNNSVSKYETELKNDRLLLVVHGTADDIEKARRVLSAQSVDLNVYEPLMKVAG